MPIDSVFRLLKKYFQLSTTASLYFFLSKNLQVLLKFPPPPHHNVGGIWKPAQNLLKKDEQERES